MKGFVSLIGAGCGSADLITLRGKDRLERCDAVVYDDLIDPALLDFAPQTALRIYMGKREGAHSAAQEDINAELICLAAGGLRVARLKGGDPFVFGRGGEEALALQKAGVPFEYIPGITSAVAIPGEAGIPVTHRGLSRSVHIITAHTADTPDGLPPELPQLANCGGTLVFLMGLNMLFDEKGYEKMAKSKLMQANQRIAEAVVDGYKKVEGAVVGGYKKVEDTVVGAYTKIEDKFVDQYLTREGESVEEAKARLKGQNKSAE
jgi:uroporphyrin-III C-methyltransferase